MTIQNQVILRSRKLGVLIRDARLATRKTLQEVAQPINVKQEVLRSWEEGRKSPSLPELEVLAFMLKLPLQHFWGKSTTSNAMPAETLNIPSIISLRQKMIGITLQQAREQAGLNLRELSDGTGISIPRIKTYEQGEKAIPLPELEALFEKMDKPFFILISQTGTVGTWLKQQKAMEEFLHLPADMQNFVCQPVNLPYLELARKLSEMSAEKLRAVAEGLLDITL